MTGLVNIAGLYNLYSRVFSSFFSVFYAGEGYYGSLKFTHNHCMVLRFDMLLVAGGSPSSRSRTAGEV